MITPGQFAAKCGVSRQRINQLVQQARIRPAPKLVTIGQKGRMYLFSTRARIIPPHKPKKPLTGVNIRL